VQKGSVRERELLFGEKIHTDETINNSKTEEKPKPIVGELGQKVRASRFDSKLGKFVFFDK
jgi:hypothetical protein